jgi:hypothetical protein
MIELYIIYMSRADRLWSFRGITAVSVPVGLRGFLVFAGAPTNA